MANLTIHNVPEQVYRVLVEAYPEEQQRNEKIVTALIGLIEDNKKQQLIQLLDRLKATPPCKPHAQSAEASVRELRQREIQKLTDNQ